MRFPIRLQRIASMFPIRHPPACPRHQSPHTASDVPRVEPGNDEELAVFVNMVR
jgi:hypothetical protein